MRKLGPLGSHRHGDAHSTESKGADVATSALALRRLFRKLFREWLRMRSTSDRSGSMKIEHVAIYAKNLERLSGYSCCTFRLFPPNETNQNPEKAIPFVFSLVFGGSETGTYAEGIGSRITERSASRGDRTYPFRIFARVSRECRSIGRAIRRDGIRIVDGPETDRGWLRRMRLARSGGEQDRDY